MAPGLTGGIKRELEGLQSLGNNPPGLSPKIPNQDSQNTGENLELT